MKNFDVFTASPENLGRFLDTLTVINSPWEDEFHKVFCADCGKEDCTACPHEKERENPLWWLMREFVDDAERQEMTESEATGEMIKAAHKSFVMRQTRAAQERSKFCTCQKCGTEWHRPDALYCCQCGTKLEQPEDGQCMEFNVYLGRKNQGGTQLHGVDKVAFPEVHTYSELRFGPELQLMFRSMEYADALIRALDEMCIIEIRAAVHNLIPSDGWVFHGNYYIFEAVPKEIVTEPLIRRGGTRVEIHLQVRRFTANDTDDKERWTIEWPGAGAENGKETQEKQE